LGKRVVNDDARKVMFLETVDGTAILGYAGLGATALGTQPADWMSAVLRGRRNLSLEQSLGVLAEAMKKQFPPHMVRMPGRDGPRHNVLVTAFLGKEVRLYTFDLVFAPDRKGYWFRYTRHVAANPARTPRIGLAGSGGAYMLHDKRWIRPLLRLLSAYDCGRVSSNVFADHLAGLNDQVHRVIGDNSVGPRCIVAWRNRGGGFHKGGGAHRFYSNKTRDANAPSLPTIANGMDLSALIDVMMPYYKKTFETMGRGEVQGESNDELDAQVARIPDEPDERLR